MVVSTDSVGFELLEPYRQACKTCEETGQGKLLVCAGLKQRPKQRPKNWSTSTFYHHTIITLHDLKKHITHSSRTIQMYCTCKLTSGKRRTGSMQSSSCVICSTSGHSESQIKPIHTENKIFR